MLTEEADKRAALLSSCREETYSVIATHVNPHRPPNADYQSIVEAVKNHINPKPSELYARYVLSKRDLHVGETVADYVTALRKLAENCGFNDKQLLLGARHYAPGPVSFWDLRQHSAAIKSYQKSASGKPRRHGQDNHAMSEEGARGKGVRHEV